MTPARAPGHRSGRALAALGVLVVACRPACSEDPIHKVAGLDCEITSAPVPLRAACHLAGGGDPVSNPWSVRTEWTYESIDTDGSDTTPLTAYMTDDDGDGEVGPGDGVVVVVLGWHMNADGLTSSATVYALDGSTGVLNWSRPVDPLGSALAIADVDGDGWPEVLTVGEGQRVEALDGTDGHPIWQSDEACEYCDAITAADLDGDERVSVLSGDLVLDGRDGHTNVRLSPTASFSGLTAADLDLDGRMSILQAGRVYDPDGTPEWSISDEWFGVSFPLVVQADTDAEAEVVWVYEGLYTLWEDDGTKLVAAPFESGDRVPGQPCAADFSGTGSVEIAIPATDQLVMMGLDGTVLWQAPVSDVSGLAGCSGFDLDGDGAAEVLYADEDTFWILDGRTGEARYQDDNRHSGTAVEYPVVADVDGDGHAEVLFVSDSEAPMLTVIENAAEGWPPAGPGWALPDFAVTNTGPSGEVPVIPEPSWQYYNMVRARPRADESPLTDLTVEPGTVCGSDSSEALRLRISNAGPAEAPEGVAVLATIGGERVGEVILPAVPGGTSIDGVELYLPGGVDPASVSLEVDPSGAVEECDEENNRYPNVAGE